MTWFKVDDGFYSHPKVLAATHRARSLWVLAGSWSATNLTDGFVPLEALKLLNATKNDAQVLVSVGLWESAKGGYRFHQWCEFQPTRETVLDKRKEWKQRQRKARMSRSDTSRDSHRQSRREYPRDLLSPVPVVPKGTTTHAPLDGGAVYPSTHDGSPTSGTIGPPYPDWLVNPSDD